MPNPLATLNAFTPQQQRLLQADPAAVSIIRGVMEGRTSATEAQALLRARLRELESSRPNLTQADVDEGWGQVGFYAINPLRIGLSMGGTAVVGAIIGGIAPNMTAGQGAKAGALAGLGFHALRTALFAGLVGVADVAVDDE